MIWLALQACVVAYLPGALLYRVPDRSRTYRSSLSFDERAFWAIVLSLSWSLAVVLGLASVGRYSFDRLLIINLVLSLALVAAFRARLAYADRAPRPQLSGAIPIALIALGAWLYFPPSEYIIGGKDPGTYLNEGIQIAQRGSVVIRDPVVATVPPALRDLFFPFHRQRWYYSSRFMGFFIQDPDRGDVIGQFPHLFPASIALGYGLNGLSGARQTVGAWAILGLVAIYFAARRFIGQPAAAAAAVLTGLNVASVWFARYPNSEVVMQAGLFSAMLAFSHARETRGRFFGTLAGCLLGAMLFLRYEVVLAFLSVGVAATLLPAGGERVSRAFGASLLAVAAVGYWYLQGTMRAYSYYPLAVTRRYGVLVLGTLAVAGLAARFVLRAERGRAFVRRAVPWTLAVTLAVLAAYAYFLRQPTGKLALGDAIAFRSFGWYVGPWVLGLATAGLAILIVRRFWQAPAFFFTAATFCVFFFYKTRIVPEHFWSGRRFLAVILPAAMIGVSGVLGEMVAEVFSRIRRTVPPTLHGLLGPAGKAVVLVGLIAPIGWGFWNASAPVRHHVEYAGIIPHLEKLAARFGPRDLVIVESRNAGSDLHTLAVPLAYIYAKNVLVLNTAVPPKPAVEQFVTWAQSHYEDLYFLGGGGTDLLTARLIATPVAADRFQVPEYESLLNALPSKMRRKDFEFGLYRLSLASGEQSGLLDVVIGGQDDLHVVRFHARERAADGMAFRWTQAQSFIVLAGLSPRATTVTIWMGSGGRPATAPVPLVEVAFNDTTIGTATPGNGIQAYTFQLPPSRSANVNEPVRLRLRVPTWNPQTALGVADGRDLGVQVTRVAADIAKRP